MIQANEVVRIARASMDGISPSRFVGGLSVESKRVGLFGNQGLIRADGDQNIASLEHVSCVVLQLQGEWE